MEASTMYDHQFARGEKWAGRLCYTTVGAAGPVRNKVLVIEELGNGRCRMRVLVLAGIAIPEPFELVSRLTDVLYAA